MGDNYYYNWAKQVNRDMQKVSQTLSEIKRHDFTCSKCQKVYTQSFQSGSTCYYCHQTYGSCCKGKYGTCIECWAKQSSSEKQIHKKRYKKTLMKNLKPILIIIPIIFFGVLGGVLMGTVNTWVGLPILLVGVFGSVGIFAFSSIRRSQAIQRHLKGDKPKEPKKPMDKYTKIAIYGGIGLIGFILLSAIILMIVFL